MMNTSPHQLSAVSGVAIGVSMVVGTGLLSLSGMALDVAGPSGSIWGWLLAALAISPFLFIFSHMGRAFPESSGLAESVAQAFGAWAGRGMAALLFVNVLLVLPTVAIVGGSYVQNLLALPTGWTIVMAIAILATATGLNLIGHTRVCSLSNVSLVVLFLLFAILLVAYPHLPLRGASMMLAAPHASALDWSQLWKVTALVIFAYLGWENLSFTAGEFRDPERMLQRSYWGSFLFVVALYVSLALLTSGAQLSGLETSGPVGLAHLFRSLPGGKCCLLAIGLVSLANATSWVSSASRSVLLASHKGYLPAWLAELSPRGIPVKMLLVSFGVEVTLVGLAHVANSGCPLLFLLVTQGFLVVYLVCTLAYWKISRGVTSWLVTIAALAASAFLLSGFSWLMIVPLFLFGGNAVRGLELSHHVPAFLHHRKRWAH